MIIHYGKKIFIYLEQYFFCVWILENAPPISVIKDIRLKCSIDSLNNIYANDFNPYANNVSRSQSKTVSKMRLANYYNYSIAFYWYDNFWFESVMYVWRDNWVLKIKVQMLYVLFWIFLPLIACLIKCISLWIKFTISETVIHYNIRSITIM